MKKEYEWTVNILSKLDIPYVGLIGNHDVIGNGDQVFNKIVRGRKLFLYRPGRQNSFASIPMRSNTTTPTLSLISVFLKEELQRQYPALQPHDRRHACTSPEANSSITNVKKTYFQLYIREFPSLLFCLNAHNHQLQVEDLFDDGIIYYGCSNIAKRNYLLFTLTPDGYTYEIINF